MNAATSKWRRLRFIPLAAGAASFAIGLWVGLARLGVALPDGTTSLAGFHGVLMISGFLGTVISLERAVAIGRWWAYAAPALSAAGAVLLFAGMPANASTVFLLAGLALTFNSLTIAIRQPALFTIALAVAAFCWVVGTAVWIAGAAIAAATGWWLGFLILTIAAERLELSRLLAPPPTSKFSFIVAAALIIGGAARGELAGDSALLSGIGLVALTAWLVKHDIPLRTIRLSGQARFTAACLLAGYFWLGFAGFSLLLFPPGTMAFSYDAAVHAIAIGFVLSMIFGHAPIILPAVAGLRIRYGAAFYAPLILLHVAVLIRIVADFLEQTDIRAISGPLTILSIIGYALTLVITSQGRAAR